MSKLTIGSLLVIVIALPLSPISQRSVSAQRRPNIIFIYADDMGYGDLGCFGARSIKTPNLDRMAAEELRLTSFYSVSPICTAFEGRADDWAIRGENGHRSDAVGQRSVSGRQDRAASV